MLVMDENCEFPTPSIGTPSLLLSDSLDTISMLFNNKENVSNSSLKEEANMSTKPTLNCLTPKSARSISLGILSRLVFNLCNFSRYFLVFTVFNQCGYQRSSLSKKY